MYEHIQSHKSPVTWVLVADGKQANIYDCRKAMQKIPLGGANKHHAFDEKPIHELVPVPNGALEAESINDYQVGHDRRGTTSSSVSSVHNSYEPHGDIKEELKRRFTEALAKKLGKAHEEKLFDHIILVAPAKMIGELREQLAPDLQRCVAAVLPKDLTHYLGHELLPHLQDTLLEAHVA